MKNTTRKADLCLLACAIIWGIGFIGTEYAINSGAKTSLIIAMRFMMAGILLGILYFKSVRKIDKKTFVVGAIAGAILFLGFYTQTLGQSLTTVSNSSFLTSTNVVMVPFIVWIFTKKHPKTKYFFLGITTLIGAGVLSLNLKDGFSFGTGDILTVISAMCFALHISFLGVFAKDKDTKQITFLQLMSAGVLALLYLLAFDRQAIDLQLMVKALPPVAFLAIFSSCICYYLQTYGQQHTAPSKAGIILCTEGLFGSIFAVLLGIDTLTFKLVLGGTIILSSVILAEVDFKKKKE